MKITRSEAKVTIDKVDAAIDSGKSVAKIAEVVMDKQFIEDSRHDWCWLSGEQIPPEPGWYRIDRDDERITKTSDTIASDIEWHERLFIYPSALQAAKKGETLALYIGDEYADRRLSALYLCGPDVLAQVPKSNGGRFARRKCLTLAPGLQRTLASFVSRQPRPE